MQLSEMLGAERVKSASDILLGKRRTIEKFSIIYFLRGDQREILGRDGLKRSQPFNVL